MNICGQSPVTTLVNAYLRNIDAVDVAATSVSCTNLTVNGEPVSNVLTNIGSSSVGNTVFNGTVTATNLTATSTVTAATVSAGSVSATGGAITGGSLTVTGSVAASSDISGSTLTGTITTPTQNNITKIGTQTSIASSGSITQTGGSTTLLSTTVGSLSTAGNITQTGAAATATLKAATATSLGISGNITQSSGSNLLNSTVMKGKLTCVASDILSGPITTGAATFTTPTAFAQGYESYTIRWFNLGCSGNFTPYLRFAKAATATYTTGYRITSHVLDHATSTVDNRVIISSRATGLANGEQMTGQISIRKVNSTQWFVEGWSQSNVYNATVIYGFFNDPGTGIDKIVFGVTQGTLNVTTASYQIVPSPV